MMNKFGIDPHHPELSQKLTEAFNKTHAQYAQHHNEQGNQQADKLYAYALVDGTFDDANLGKQLWELSQENDSGIVSLYDNTSLSGFEECAPFLVNLSSDNLKNLLVYGADKPMLSFLQTPLNKKALQRHFAAFLCIHTPSDGLRFPLRFSDTMCSIDILEMLDETQLEMVLSGFTAWHLINRKGTVTTIAGDCMDLASYIAPNIGEKNAIDITDRQYVRLIDSGEADGMLCGFIKNTPQITSGRTASKVFAMITELLTEMDTRGIKDDINRRQLMVKTLLMPDKYHAIEVLDTAQKHDVAKALQYVAT
ncbi:DUF4123 domain-containing protein [Glaciimonas soli]|uniref:DUF4123 domain-containing protein n=1 Tax=Glaciimonas soli TaxID=2590999 RepID=A0A843YK63_9BURK|nr:DUF4123 domain-containing protein [Glaciimonas soli]MQR00189.1 DUF4123 domain-containing protein [Glaciimonas soli]